jgi:DNA polymerase-3 subunit gamma/tau
MKEGALYNKYRPHQLDELVGQKNVVATFTQASNNDKFAQTYIFTGNRGCGKTTTARIVANLLTCENVKGGRVCGKCRACQIVPTGMAMDVIELDGAKNRNVEHVEGLIDGAQWSPSELKRKVYIIDECHQLSDKAISALLKITEEPPSYVTFIFCTTDAHKIPETILSRSQRFNFRKIASKEMVARLRFIADSEKIKISDGALFSIAKISRGCLRDAISPLEQISTLMANKEITEEVVQKYFSIPDRQAIFQMVKSMITGNFALLMDQVNDLIMASADVEAIAFEVSEIFRSMMLLKVQGNTKLLDIPDHEIEELKKLAEPVKLGQLDKLSKLFSSIKREITYSINERWILESTLIHCAALLRKV